MRQPKQKRGLIRKATITLAATAACSLPMLAPQWMTSLSACSYGYGYGYGVYDSTDRKITFYTLAMELYNPITDEPNDQFALFDGVQMRLNALPGFYDFQYEGDMPSYANQIVSESDNCYPTYSAKEETVHFPKVEVPLVGVLLDGSTVYGPPACYEALFRQSITQPEVFSLKEVTEIACD